MSPVRVTKPSGYRLWWPLVVVSAILALSGLTACSAESTSAEGAGEKTTQSATPSSTWTPNIPKKTKAPTYEKPNGAIDAKEAIDEFFANNTVESILERRRSNNPEDIKWARDMILALSVEALHSQESLFLPTIGECYGDNWLFRDVHKMTPDQLIDSLDNLGFVAVATTKEGYTTASHANVKIDEEKSLKILALAYGPEANGAMDVISDFYRKEQGTLTVAQWDDPKRPDRTATIVKSEMEQMGDESVEVITVKITGDQIFRDQEEVTRQYYLMPVGTLYGINGISEQRIDSDPIDYNRPAYDKHAGYVTKSVKEGDIAGEPIRIPVLKQ